MVFRKVFTYLTQAKTMKEMKSSTTPQGTTDNEIEGFKIATQYQLESFSSDETKKQLNYWQNTQMMIKKFSQ